MLIEHNYGSNIHILDNPFISSLLTEFSTHKVQQPHLTGRLRAIYEHFLAFVLSRELKTHMATVDTRMAEMHPKEAKLKSTVFDSEQLAVSVDLARAGMLPSQVCYELLNHVLPPHKVRQDHVWASRRVDENNHVIGTDFDGSKIGGPVDDAIVFFPDPMGATGGTLKSVIEYYQEKVEGKAKLYVGLHLIVTPEFVKTVKDIPNTVIYACRLDRGLSPNDVLDKIPGEDWENERGLNENGYIVPGAGGVGELLNNAYV